MNIYKFKKIKNYAIFGILTTIVNIMSFFLLTLLRLDYRIANVIAFILAILFAFVTNKQFVFKSKANSAIDYIKESVRFFISRLLTLVIDFLGMVLLVELLFVDELISKVVMNIIVIVLNYIISELFVFK